MIANAGGHKTTGEVSDSAHYVHSGRQPQRLGRSGGGSSSSDKQVGLMQPQQQELKQQRLLEDDGEDSSGLGDGRTLVGESAA